VSADAQDVVEPKSGVKFASRDGKMSLAGVGLRTRTMLKVKVYAIGLYVVDAGLSGKSGTRAFYENLVNGDFEKQIVLKFTRDLSADQIQGAFRESLQGGEKTKVELFVSAFGDVKTGDEAVLHWAPGGTLEVKVAGLGKAPIADKAFAARVFGIWLGDKPVQDDIKKDLVSRVVEVTT
jgi:hypothetical protein